MIGTEQYCITPISINHDVYRFIFIFPTDFSLDLPAAKQPWLEIRLQKINHRLLSLGKVWQAPLGGHVA